MINNNTSIIIDYIDYNQQTYIHIYIYIYNKQNERMNDNNNNTLG